MGTTLTVLLLRDQQALPIQAGDCFLLCSDGLTGMLPDTQISSILADNSLPQAGCEELIAAALAAGGKDNVTAVLVTVDPK
jgi:protein phosphatase